MVKVRDEKGQLNNIKIHRLKDKLGTHGVPTAELELVGTHAYLVSEPGMKLFLLCNIANVVNPSKGRGVAEIAALFNVTRLWVAVTSISVMR